MEQVWLLRPSCKRPALTNMPQQVSLRAPPTCCAHFPFCENCIGTLIPDICLCATYTLGKCSRCQFVRLITVRMCSRKDPVRVLISTQFSFPTDVTGCNLVTMTDGLSRTPLHRELLSHWEVAVYKLEDICIDSRARRFCLVGIS